jgi:hypothetical protein
MAIARYENVVINNLTHGKDAYGEQTTTITPWFTSRASVKDVRNSVRISDRYRVYSDLVDLTFQYTPNMKQIVDDQDKYSFVWRNRDWRITDCFESDDRMRITFICYRNDPQAPV